MTNRKAILSLSLILVFLLSNLSIPINAVDEGEGDLVETTDSFNLDKNPTYKFVETTNGKMVYMQVKQATDPIFYFNVYTGTTQIANVSYTYNNVLGSCVVYDFSMIEISSTEVISFVLLYVSTGIWPKLLVMVLKFNTANNAINSYVSTLMTTGNSDGTGLNGFVSEIIKIGTKYYMVIHARWNDSGSTATSRLQMVDYDGVSTITAGSAYAINSDYLTSITGFLNDAEEHYYFITSIASDSTAKYFDADISTKGITLLATEGIAGHYSVDLTSANFIYGLGGGIITNGTILTMYFAYTYPSSTFTGGYYINYIRFEQHRITFNTTIGALTVLEQQDRFTILEADNSYVIHKFPSFGWEINQTSYTIHYINDLGDDYGGYQYVRAIVSITDWYNMSGGGIGATFDYDMRDNPEFGMDSPYYTGYIGITPTSRYVIRYHNTVALTIYLIEPLTVIWELTISYTPADSPLYTLTSYLFELYITGNDIGKSDCVLEVYVNGYIYDTYVPEGGIVDFTYITSTRGIHSFEFIIKDITLTEVLSEEINYLFINMAGEGVTEGLVTTGLEFIINMIPITLCLAGFGGLFFYVTNHWIGFIAGLTIGCLIAVVTNILPFYSLFIIVLVDLLIIVFMRGNTSG